MPRILLVTNDFPPTVGGIQSYLRDFVSTLPADEVVVFASTQDAQAAREFDAHLPYRVVRWPGRILLPTPAASRRMQGLIREFNITTVWFGAAAPLGLLGAAAKAAGAQRVVVSTHGHEVGWARVPVARQLLRRIGVSADIATYISEYTLRRLQPAFGQVEWAHLPSGVDTERFAPTMRRSQVRARWGLSEHQPVVCCISRLVPRKGQDALIRAWPIVLQAIPDATLVLVGDGKYRRRLIRLAAPLGASVRFLGPLDDALRTAFLASSDVFAMPARTRCFGIDVEGLGIVYLEAQACGIPVIAGNSGGAPETITENSGVVVDGRNIESLAQALISFLENPQLCAEMGEAGRRNAQEYWSWREMGNRLARILNYT
ncbi:glycosyltransferase family 4 protein [Corynebacterium freiburgense]|uniref:glycosyltransferase family 4 protein n=1 Tax=Corynebacterium freiburgense TaxID=556548 RepID=UPI00041807BD|nr:glycosyltransferase family 4 protein [Corynebacterium freiburgense]WJZ03184.1 GDP-mannose-dependent alpha-(1-6)-phosphatidylinositol monomannoside mannosyltransferase [Corynebacterium freiburgense]